MCSHFFFGWVTPNDPNSKTKIQNGKDFAEKIEMSKSTTGKTHSRDETSIPAKHQTYQQTYPTKNKSSSPTSRLLRLFEI